MLHAGRAHPSHFAPIPVCGGIIVQPTSFEMKGGTGFLRYSCHFVNKGVLATVDLNPMCHGCQRFAWEVSPGGSRGSGCEIRCLKGGKRSTLLGQGLIYG